MSKEINIIGGPTGLTLYAVVYAPDRSKRLSSASVNTFTLTTGIATGSWATGLVALTENLDQNGVGTGDYYADFPTYVTTPGEYGIKITSGNSTASACIASQTVPWTGTSMITLASLFTQLGNPAGASLAADIAQVETNASNAATSSASAATSSASAATSSASASTAATNVYNIVNSGTFGNSVIQTALATLQTNLGTAGAGLTALPAVTLATSQPNYAPAKVGAQMDLVNAPNATAITAINAGQATSTAVANVQTTVNTINTNTTGLATATNLANLQTTATNTYNIVNSGTFGNSALNTLLGTIETHAAAADTQSSNTYAIVNNGTYGNSALHTQVEALNNFNPSTQSVTVGGYATNQDPATILVNSGPFSTTITGSVWDAAYSSHTTGGSFGATLANKVFGITGQVASQTDVTTVGTTATNIYNIVNDPSIGNNAIITGVAATFSQAATAASAASANNTLLLNPTYGLAEILDTLDSTFNIVNNGTYGNQALQVLIVALNFVIISDTVQSSPSPTTTVFAGSGALSSSNISYQNMFIHFSSGANAGEARRIASYVGSTNAITLDTALPVAPSTTDTFDILGYGG